MSNTIRGGRSIDLNVQAGESLKVSTLTGTYTATVLAGAGAGTALATDSSGGATYGPYAAGVVIRVKCSADGLADIDVGVSPALNYAEPARFGYGLDGDVSSLVDGAGNVVGIGGVISLQPAAGGATAATANTATLNAALLGQSTRKFALTAPGVYEINGALTVYDDTEIFIGAGVELKMADLGRKMMFINSEYAATENAVTGMTAVGNIATVLSAVSPAVGQYVAIKGVTTKGYCGVWCVVAVTAGVSFTVRMIGIPAVTTAAGTIVWCSVNRNIRIYGPGKLNHNQRGQGVAIDSTDNAHTILFRHVDQIRIGHSGLQMVDARKWSIFLACVGICDLTGDFNNTDPSLPGLSSACIDIQGPCVSAKVHDCTGVSSDDCLVFTMGDVAYIDKSRGDFYNLEINNINMTTNKLLIRVSGNANCIFHNIEIKNVKGTADSAGIGFVDFGVALTGTSIDRCIIDGVEIDTMTAVPVVSMQTSVAANMGTIIVRNLRQKISNGIGVNVSGSVTIKHLTVEDVIADSSNGNPVASVGATVTRCDFSRWKVDGGVGCFAAYVTGVINRLSIRDFEVSGSGARVFAQQGTVNEVFIDGVTQLSGYCMVEQNGSASASTRYYVNQCRIAGVTSVFRFTKAVQLLTNQLSASVGAEIIQSSGGVCSWGGEYYAPGMTESTLTGGATISKLAVQVA